MTYIKHGLYHHPLCKVWYNMKHRISNKNNRDYHCYGGKGITICEEWKDDPTNFIIWAENNGYQKGLMLDRIDNNLGYYPKNCQFITPAQSILNRRLLRKDNTSGYCGVSYDKNARKYSAFIKVNKIRRYLGLFNSARMAALRYDAEAFLLNDGRPVNFT